jgi:hypothetical protein
MEEVQYDESGGYWETADDGNGNTYYYHTVTGETTWDNPYAGVLVSALSLNSWSRCEPGCVRLQGMSRMHTTIKRNKKG